MGGALPQHRWAPCLSALDIALGVIVASRLLLAASCARIGGTPLPPKNAITVTFSPLPSSLPLPSPPLQLLLFKAEMSTTVCMVQMPPALQGLDCGLRPRTAFSVVPLVGALRLPSTQRLSWQGSITAGKAAPGGTSGPAPRRGRAAPCPAVVPWGVGCCVCGERVGGQGDAATVHTHQPEGKGSRETSDAMLSCFDVHASQPKPPLSFPRGAPLPHPPRYPTFPSTLTDSASRDPNVISGAEPRPPMGASSCSARASFSQDAASACGVASRGGWERR